MKLWIKKIGSDLVLNIFSYALPVLILQFLVLPVLAKIFDSEQYGLILSLTSIVSIMGEMAGGNLANVRLIYESRYIENSVVGDYKIIFTKLIGLLGIISIFIFLIGYKLNGFQIVLLLIYFLFFSLRSYLTVGYRLELKYSMVFVNNLVLCVGYIVGLFITYLSGMWEAVYITGFCMASIHVLFTTTLKKEPMVKTDFYSAVFKKTIILMLAYLVGNSMNYFDRILLYPLVGGTSVSLYYVATVFGKVLNLLIAPINMVILSYLSKKNQISQKEIFVCFAGLVGLGAIFVAISVGAAPIILKILYPDYLNKVINLVPIATCSAVLMACTSLFKTLSMRFVSEKYIFITEIIYMVAYFGLGILFLHLFSLVGFCFATTIAASIRFIFFLFGLLAVNDKR